MNTKQLPLPPTVCFGLPTALFYSPTLPRRKNPLRKRASTGERAALMALMDTDCRENARKVIHYKIFVKNAELAELQENVIAKMHHGDEIDRNYNSVHVMVHGMLNNASMSVIELSVDVPCEKKDKNTGSDVYLHYLREIKKAKLDIVKTVVESSCNNPRAAARASFQSSN